MILPMTFGNVVYRAAGSSKYKGDLILIPEAVYYFPHTNVANKRSLVIVIILLIVLAPLLASISILFLYVFLSFCLVVFAFLGILKPDLIVDMVSGFIKEAWELKKNSQERHRYTADQSDEQQQSEAVNLYTPINLYPIILYPTLWYSLILESALLTLKENKSLSPYSLPTPIRFSKSHIQHISLSSKGVLTIKPEYDVENKFHLSNVREDMLKKGLIEGGFIS
jgi:hypothetical protein